MDAQQIELIGRSLLQAQLLREDIEIALPIRDKGIDLVAYLDRRGESQPHSCFLQMKAASNRAFSFNTKYQHFGHFKFVYIWHVLESEKVRFFLLSYSEAESLCRHHAWTPTRNGFERWSTSNPSGTLSGKLEKFQVVGRQWRQKLFCG